jgi:cysteine synthase A
MMEKGQTGSIVSLMCDSGDRYLDTYYNPDWVQKTFGDIGDYSDALNLWLTESA